MSTYGISTEFTESVRFVTTVHSIDIFGPERIEMGANKYRKGIRNSSANSVNQVDSRNWPRIRIRIKIVYW